MSFAPHFKLNLVTPDKRFLIEKSVTEVVIPSARGDLSILPGHTPLIGLLGVGRVSWKEIDSNSVGEAALSWGCFEVHAKGVNVMADDIEEISRLDFKRIESELALLDKDQMEGKSSEVNPHSIERERERLSALGALSNPGLR